METIGYVEAEAQLPRLLERVERGEGFTITRHGRPVAQLLPVTGLTPRPDVRGAIEALKAFQQREAPTLGDDLTVRDLIDEGRQF